MGERKEEEEEKKEEKRKERRKGRGGSRMNGLALEETWCYSSDFKVGVCACGADVSWGIKRRVQAQLCLQL